MNLHIAPQKTVYLDDVYTPSCPAKLNFVERQSLRSTIERNLKMRGRQVVVYGHTGSGKTSLLDHTLNTVYPKYIKTNCMSDSTFESIILDAFDQLEHSFISEEVEGKKAEGKLSLSASIKLIRAQLSGRYEKSSQTKTIRSLPPQLTGSGLAKLIGEAGICWVIEDFHKVKEEDKIQLSQLMKVFMDKSNDYRKLKMVAVGAVNSARQVVQYDQEMSHRVAEINVPLMSNQEIKELILNGQELLKIDFDSDVVNEVTRFSNGVAAVAHSLCHLMCSVEGIDEILHYGDGFELDEVFDRIEITMAHFNQAVLDYLDEQSDTLKSAFDKAMSIQDADCVLYAISQANESGLSPRDLEAWIEDSSLKFTCLNFERLCKDLVTPTNGAVLRHDSDANKYCFRDPFYHSFASMFFKQAENLPQRDRMSSGQMTDFINAVFKSMTTEFKSTGSMSGDIATTTDSDSEKDYLNEKMIIETREKKRDHTLKKVLDELDQ